MSVNLNLKAELIKQFGSQVEAAKALGILENRLSYIIRCHLQPSERSGSCLTRQSAGTVEIYPRGGRLITSIQTRERQE